MTKHPFSGLGMGSYGAILADPPWSFKTYTKEGTTPHRTEAEPYPVMKIGDIMRLPVSDLAARNCALFLWVIDPLLDVGIQTGKLWGFKYITRAFEWDKGSIGMGFWTRKEGESCLMFTRGKPRRLSKGVRHFIREPRREHSRKPDEAYNRIEQLVEGPYCELFSTRYWPGWDGWGRDYPKYPPEEIRAIDRRTKAVDGMIRKWNT